MNHCSTAQQRVQWISQLLVAERPHGVLSQLSRTHHVSRQTLYRWKEKGVQALQAALESSPVPPTCTKQVQEQVLTLLIEGHNSYRDIQTCLLKLCGVHISLGSIAAIVPRSRTTCATVVESTRCQDPSCLGVG